MAFGSLGFLGGGNMGEALIRAATHIPNIKIGVFEKNAERVAFLRKKYVSGLTILSAPTDLGTYDAIVIAVKPQQFKEAAATLKDHVDPGKLIISIAAGIPLSTIASSFAGCACVRVMPNTPALIGEGMTGIAFGAGITPDQKQFVTALFSAIGLVESVPERLINAITAVSGSGPAYFYHLVDVMATQAERLGLTHDVALKLVTQTMIGAAKMIQKNEQTPTELIKQVSSPGGTTEAAMKVLLASDLSQIWQKTFQAATNRAEELSRS